MTHVCLLERTVITDKHSPKYDNSTNIHCCFIVVMSHFHNLLQINEMNKRQCPIVDPTSYYRSTLDSYQNTHQLISFSGIDGSGKSTQTHLLSNRLLKENHSVLAENYKTAKNAKFTNALERLYFEAHQRGEVISQDLISLFIAFEYFTYLVNKINQALVNGMYVVCDRYIYDLYVSQQHVFGVDFRQGWHLLQKTPLPGIALYIDVPVDLAIVRLQRRKHSIRPHEKKESLQVKRKAYLELCQAGFLQLIDGTQSAESLHTQIWGMVCT